jgi:hypothetical protein
MPPKPLGEWALRLLPLFAFRRKEIIMENEAIQLTPLELPTKDTQAVHLHFSFSQLVTYLMCPMKYAHQYVYGTRWETRPAALPFGKAIHKTAESYYCTLMQTGEILPVEKLQDTFLAFFLGEADKGDVPLSFKKGEDLETLKGMGKELVRLFQENAQPQKIVAVDFPSASKCRTSGMAEIFPFDWKASSTWWRATVKRPMRSLN